MTPRRPARIQEVANAAGVSTSTVSNYLNRPERLSEATAAKVREAIRVLDYVPHLVAAELRHGRMSLVGVIVPDIVNSFYASIVQGAGDVARTHGFSLVLCDSGDDAGREVEYFSMLADQRAAGAVVVPLGADPERLDWLRQRGIPIVLADRTTGSTLGCSVGVDDVIGGRLAVEHLLAVGARTVVVVNGDWGIRQCVDRFGGAMQAIEAVPSASVRQLVAGKMTVAAGIEIGRQLLDDPPDAVFCTNDFLAVGVCRSLHEGGMTIPQDIQVVGYGDLDIASSTPVPLTTMRQPVTEIGRAAMGLLIDDIQAGEDHQHQTHVFKPELVIRASTTLWSCGQDTAAKS